jgi:hypothetical protein
MLFRGFAPWENSKVSGPKSLGPITIGDEGYQVNAIGDVLSASASTATDVPISAAGPGKGDRARKRGHRRL